MKNRTLSYRTFSSLGLIALMLVGLACSQSDSAADSKNSAASTPAPKRELVKTTVRDTDTEWIAATEGDWPCWRSENHMGEADPAQSPPTTWSETEGVVWKSPIPGRGHGSPTVVGNRIYLPTAYEDKGSQAVLCYNRETGEKIWETEVHPSGAMMKNKKASAASSTIAWDGERLLINFPTSDAIFTTALSPDGKILWQTRINDYVVHQGYGASPLVYEDLVIVAADNKGGGALAALNRETGKIVWKNKRPATANYPSPVVHHLNGQDQLIMTGCELVSSFDPLTGKTLWEIPGATTECVTTTVTDGKRVFSSGGYPKNHIAGILADGSGKVEWDIGDRVYVPSFLIRDNNLFGVMDAGVAGCWDSATGKELWKGRLGGNFTASPILVGDTIYATSEAGETTLFRANAKKFEKLRTNKLGDEVLATPTICGGRIYMRVGLGTDDDRQEVMYCLGVAK